MNAHAVACTHAVLKQEPGEAVGQELELPIAERLVGADHGGLFGRVLRPACDQLIETCHDNPNERAMIMRCISDVPEKILEGMASRSKASTPVSDATPEPPKIWIASRPD